MAMITFGSVGVMFGPRLVRNGARHLAQKRRVEAGSQADRLRKHSGSTCPSQAMQALVPPIVGLDSEPGDGRSIVQQLRGFLCGRQARQQIRDALLVRQVRIPKG